MTEAQICRPAQEELDALARKRNDPERLKPLTPEQVARAHRIATAAVNALKEQIKESQQLEEQEWSEATRPLRVN